MLDIAQLRPGDILLSRIPMNLQQAATWDSHLVQTITKSRFSHAALYIDDGLFIEAVGTGIGRLPVQRAGVGDAGNICVLRMRHDVTSRHTTVGRRAAACGQRYLGQGFYRAGTPCNKGSAFHDLRRAAVLCSSMIATAYEEAEWPLIEGKSSDQAMPGDLLNSPHLEDVTASVLIPLRGQAAFPYCLDSVSLFERVHHWEVITQLKVLCSFDVRRILDMAPNRPASFRELLVLIAERQWSALDEAVCRGLAWYRYAAVYQEKLQWLADDSGVGERTAQRLPQLLGMDQLAAVSQLGSGSLQHLQLENRHWRRELELCRELQQKHPAKTFGYLIDLYARLVESSDGWIKSKQKTLRAFDQEIQRHGDTLKTA